MSDAWLPAFRPMRWLTSGHAQTLVAFFAREDRRTDGVRRHAVLLADGDRVVLHDDCPATWRPGDRAALLVPGLGGTFKTPYLARSAAKLNARGVRTFRLDQRGCGAAAMLARWPYHAGRSEDVAAVLRAIDRLCHGSPTALVGFSLGGNIALKLAGEAPDRLPPNLASVMAVCPPVDLAACAAALDRPANRLYNAYFVRVLLRTMVPRHRAIWPASADGPPPRSIHEFNRRYLAPACGFGTVDRYYELCSAAPSLPAIRLPTLVLAAHDDPVVPALPLERAAVSPSTHLALTRHGGHLGYYGTAAPPDPDRRWLDWRVVDWVTRSAVPNVGRPAPMPRPAAMSS